ncbi:hypothetical protein EX895_004698 [Sporisorium graminicola]|uniref:Ubiquinone biosynthesis protein n=1 Tax=Sporisorium graminicola TaxID=280036 RepID=A0A4V6ETG0_9BASI|nr:hypothetical protein EX895_004698 [Sporisorium graminicola]TKY86549.1 hypothetical protein EX895_004698 [Sporisorium graminicola]
MSAAATVATSTTRRSIASSARTLARSRCANVAKQPSIQLSRLFSGTTWQRDTAQPSLGSSPDQHSTSSSSTHPDAATQLLLETIPAIPQYGFTKDAYLCSSTAADRLKRERIVHTLFPGPASTFDARLFTAWNNVCDLAVVHSVSPERVLGSLKSGQNVGARESKPVRTQSSLSKDAETIALAKVASVIEERLRLSWSVRHHLTHGLTALSTLSPTTSTLHSIFPHQTLLPNLPTPLPLLDLTSTFIETVLTQGQTGWIDPDTTEWYAVRARLTLAYTAATLHAASSQVLHFQDTQRLFQSVVSGRENGLAATVEDVVGRAAEWTRWGGRGWLGVLRSLGL